MSYRSNLVYYYDGTYDGFMCCVFESFDKKELPISIELYDCEQSTLFTVKEIYTDKEKADRVKKSIAQKISLEAKELIEESFLTNLCEKELHILYFMRLGYKVGRRVTEMLDNEDVAELKKAVLHLSHEAHLYTGFVRFSDYDGVLMAQISPKNNVLPLIAPHFCDRYSGETFMIYDNIHRVALVYKDGKRSFINADNIETPSVGVEEEKYRALWKKFYDTIGIEGRKNHLGRQTHMPKRYWDNMTEFQR